MLNPTEWTRRFSDIGLTDIGLVGGKNASLGEMIRELTREGICVPDGFATTARAYWRFVDANNLREFIRAELERFARGEQSLQVTGTHLRDAVMAAEFPDELRAAILGDYATLAAARAEEAPAVAVRSSATAEDLPEASFAGQQESFLNVRGQDALLDACRRCLASLFTDRAIAYRVANGIDHMQVALSIGVQRMVRADLGSAGVMFSIDTDSGFPDAILINAAWGLGESVVRGSVDPDEYMLYKPFLANESLVPIIQKGCGKKEEKVIYEGRGSGTLTVATSPDERRSFVLTDDEVVQLGRWAAIIERHYGRPMDMEWAKDGDTGEMFILQARPETVESRKVQDALGRYRLTSPGKVLTRGVRIGDAIATGRVCRLSSPSERERFPDGGILVAVATDPDWVPVMKRAAAIVTDHGGRTSHAAIVSRELGLPGVIGTGDATEVLKDGDEVTVSCAEGESGLVYAGKLPFTHEEKSLLNLPETRVRVMLNLANPGAATRWWRLPSDGVGLARMEFIINNLIKVHPMALLKPDRIERPEDKERIRALTRAWSDGPRYFVDSLAHGIGMIAAVQYPKPTILRMSDFKTNEYARLLGGSAFEPNEANPMIGWRGASRYYSEGYREGFALECQAVRKVRNELGFDNVIVMIPFCRTLAEADRVLETMASHGLERGVNGLEVYVMCEVPSNVILAEQFAERFDGFSIGSNDLTQFVLAVDRDSASLSHLFDERNEAVTTMIKDVIKRAHAKQCMVGFCGQKPSDDPTYARFLVEAGIDSISVTPDSFLNVRENVAAAEGPPNQPTES